MESYLTRYSSYSAVTGQHMQEIPHGYQDIYSQSSWRFPHTHSSSSRGSSMSTISSSLSSMSAPEDYSSSPHSSPGRVMVGTNTGQYTTTTSPHSSPGGRVSSPGSQCGEAGGQQPQYQYPDYNQYYH